MMSLAPQGVRQVDPTPSCSEFHSARIESMIASRSEFDTELEFRTAHSKVHWSELMSACGNEDLNEESVEDHRRDFVELQKDAHWGSFCNDVADVVLGKKLGEGAQAVVYEAQVTFVEKYSWMNEYPYVVKVMKGDCALADLQRQWPRGLVAAGDESFRFGALVKDPVTQRTQFGFVMLRYWGDLRTLIDLRMEHKNARDPPFTVAQAKWFMFTIATWMSKLHRKGIIHRDLKASNVLVSQTMEHDLVSSNDTNHTFPCVADYECSIGVVGTGFWRAPEIFQQLKNKVPSSKLEFTEKVDVYSFAMTCYEIVTGLIPFEDPLPNTSETRDAILNGARPELPHNLDPKIREIITSCWDPSPSLRPSFQDLFSVLLDEVNYVI